MPDSSRTDQAKAPAQISSQAWIQAWKGFLPSRAIVMARRDPPPTRVPAKVLPSSNTQLISAQFAGCMDCKLCETHKTMILGEGNPHAALVFVGKSPDSQKEIQDRPFIGEASLLLNRMIEAMGLKSEQVFIAHIVKDYPSDKNPLQATPPVQINPKVIVALGESAAQTLLQSKESISGLRGKFHPYCATLASMQLMPTFHPSDLIKTPASKRETWSDLQKVAKTLGIEIPKR